MDEDELQRELERIYADLVRTQQSLESVTNDRNRLVRENESLRVAAAKLYSAATDFVPEYDRDA